MARQRRKRTENTAPDLGLGAHVMQHLQPSISAWSQGWLADDNRTAPSLLRRLSLAAQSPAVSLRSQAAGETLEHYADDLFARRSAPLAINARFLSDASDASAEESTSSTEALPPLVHGVVPAESPAITSPDSRLPESGEVQELVTDAATASLEISTEELDAWHRSLDAQPSADEGQRAPQPRSTDATRGTTQGRDARVAQAGQRPVPIRAMPASAARTSAMEGAQVHPPRADLHPASPSPTHSASENYSMLLAERLRRARNPQAAPVRPPLPMTSTGGSEAQPSAPPVQTTQSAPVQQTVSPQPATTPQAGAVQDAPRAATPSQQSASPAAQWNPQKSKAQEITERVNRARMARESGEEPPNYGEGLPNFAQQMKQRITESMKKALAESEGIDPKTVGETPPPPVLTREEAARRAERWRKFSRVEVLSSNTPAPAEEGVLPKMPPPPRPEAQKTAPGAPTAGADVAAQASPIATPDDAIATESPVSAVARTTSEAESGGLAAGAETVDAEYAVEPIAQEEAAVEAVADGPHVAAPAELSDAPAAEFEDFEAMLEALEEEPLALVDAAPDELPPTLVGAPHPQQTPNVTETPEVQGQEPAVSSARTVESKAAASTPGEGHSAEAAPARTERSATTAAQVDAAGRASVTPAAAKPSSAKTERTSRSTKTASRKAEQSSPTLSSATVDATTQPAHSEASAPASAPAAATPSPLQPAAPNESAAEPTASTAPADAEGGFVQETHAMPLPPHSEDSRAEATQVAAEASEVQAALSAETAAPQVTSERTVDLPAASAADASQTAAPGAPPQPRQTVTPTPATQPPTISQAFAAPTAGNVPAESASVSPLPPIADAEAGNQTPADARPAHSSRSTTENVPIPPSVPAAATGGLPLHVDAPVQPSEQHAAAERSHRADAPAAERAHQPQSPAAFSEPAAQSQRTANAAGAPTAHTAQLPPAPVPPTSAQPVRDVAPESSEITSPSAQAHGDAPQQAFAPETSAPAAPRQSSEAPPAMPPATHATAAAPQSAPAHGSVAESTSAGESPVQGLSGQDAFLRGSPAQEATGAAFDSISPTLAESAHAEPASAADVGMSGRPQLSAPESAQPRTASAPSLTPAAPVAPASVRSAPAAASAVIQRTPDPAAQDDTEQPLSESPFGEARHDASAASPASAQQQDLPLASPRRKTQTAEQAHAQRAQSQPSAALHALESAAPNAGMTQEASLPSDASRQQGAAQQPAQTESPAASSSERTPAQPQTRVTLPTSDASDTRPMPVVGAAPVHASRTSQTAATPSALPRSVAAPAPDVTLDTPASSGDAMRATPVVAAASPQRVEMPVAHVQRAQTSGHAAASSQGTSAATPSPARTALAPSPVAAPGRAAPVAITRANGVTQATSVEVIQRALDENSREQESESDDAISLEEIAKRVYPLIKDLLRDERDRFGRR